MPPVRCDYMPFPFSDSVLISYLSFENAIKLRLVYSLCVLQYM